MKKGVKEEMDNEREPRKKGENGICTETLGERRSYADDWEWMWDGRRKQSRTRHLSTKKGDGDAKMRWRTMGVYS